MRVKLQGLNCLYDFKIVNRILASNKIEVIKVKQGVYNIKVYWYIIIKDNTELCSLLEELNTHTTYGVCIKSKRQPTIRRR